jgi:DNA-binding SARP family transcriptional activator
VAAFSVLGPLEVCLNGVVVPVQSPSQRVVLAALLMKPNHLVPSAELAAALWGTCPPPSERVTLQNHVKRLRQVLADIAHVRIVTTPPGYTIRVATDELDVLQFDVLYHSALDATRVEAWDRAAKELRIALSLWRGEPLANVPSELLTVRDVPALGEALLQAQEARVEADLHLGRHGPLIAELHKLIATHPFRERLRGLLMKALCLDGQQAAALAVYRDTRQLLVQELGIEPGHDLRQLEQRVLRSEPVLHNRRSSEPSTLVS